MPDILPPMSFVRRLDLLPDPESAFVRLFGASANAFWLDGNDGERGRFSFMGDAGGPLAATVTYDIDSGLLRIARHGRVETRAESIFDFLAAELERAKSTVVPKRAEGVAADLPFGFDCGFVGYLGYELKAECGATAAHTASTPDAAFVLADRLIALDRRKGHTYLLSLAPEDPWLDETEERLASLQPVADTGEPLVGPQTRAEARRPPSPVPFELRRSRRRYRDDVEACKRYLTAGHSYEICLTNKVTAEVDADPLDLYRRLRRANPAPFSAYLRFGDLAVLSSSPERFLSVDARGLAESRPIKGTSRRGETPKEDAGLAAALSEGAKFRAENVTIVDLMRNDLGRVCELGSVSVPELMRVESYETVHQLVSSVRGRLRPGLGAIDAVRACFPPGSMTGAPKLRTMEILDQLEGEARGVYSGAIGWFGRGGACDLSVAIRTIVLDGKRASVGAGGAVVVDSAAEEELAEMLLKAAAPAVAVDPGAAISFAPVAAPDDSWRRQPTPTQTS
ncbi:MAG TPA: aminodeoxychorismate synthase component I [Solirubrobacterales bacterium]|nr:aminodeoxychorismate synthase component I [Solirubrobacterales bacterium]